MDLASQLEALTLRSQEISKTALKGCYAETYGLMSELLNQTALLIPSLAQGFTLQFNSVVKDLLEAQEKNDLLRISDDLGYELPWILRQAIDN